MSKVILQQLEWYVAVCRGEYEAYEEGKKSGEEEAFHGSGAVSQRILTEWGDECKSLYICIVYY